MVIIWGDAVEDEDGAACDTGDRLRETLVYSGLEPASVEGIEIGIKWSITLQI